jgi:ankyrin repeat protein
MTALHWVAFRKTPLYTKLLIDAGADVNVRQNDGGTPLYHMVGNADEETLRLLLRAKADPNTECKPGYIPILRSIACGRDRILAMLIDHGSDFDSSGSSDTTPLMVAVYHDQLPCTTLHLARGANVNLQAINGATALHSGK